MIFSNNLGRELAEKVSKKSKIPLGKALIKRFRDREIRIKIEEDLKGKDVFVFGCLKPPADNILEFVLLVDSVKRLNPKSLTLIIPYLGYARQDRYFEGEPLSAEVVSGIINSLGAGKIFVIDIHSKRMENMIENCENISSVDILAEKFKGKGFTVVAPDKGAVEHAEKFAEKIKADVSYLEKHRPEVGKAEITDIKGEVGKSVIILDDMIDTGGTILKSAEFLKDKGVKNIIVVVTHGLFSGGFGKFEKSGIKEIIVTDTIPQKTMGKKKVVSVAGLIAQKLR